MSNETPVREGMRPARPRPSALAVSRLVNHSISARDMSVSYVKIFRRDVLVLKSLPRGVVPGRYGMGGKRQAITEFTDKSRYRLLHTVKNVACDFGTMVTLTYPADWSKDGKTVKLHLRAFLKRLLRKWPGIQGVWFLEFQKRGAPHFHLLLSLKLWDLGKLIEKKRNHKGKGQKVFRTVKIYQELLSSWWFEIVNSGDVKHLRAGCAVEVIEEEQGALRYAACHAAKPHQKKVPADYQDVGRFWGVIGGVKASCIEVQACDASAVFGKLGVDAMSNKGRVKKYLWDASELWQTER